MESKYCSGHSLTSLSGSPSPGQGVYVSWYLFNLLSSRIENSLPLLVTLTGNHSFFSSPTKLTPGMSSEVTLFAVAVAVVDNLVYNLPMFWLDALVILLSWFVQDVLGCSRKLPVTSEPFTVVHWLACYISLSQFNSLCSWFSPSPVLAEAASSTACLSLWAFVVRPPMTVH